MSSTRKAAPGSPLRQERYCSSRAIMDNGLKPACVAKRCMALDDVQQREIVWFLQARSHQSPDGLGQVTRELLEQFAERITLPGLVDFSGRTDKPLAPALVRELRQQTDKPDAFLLTGELSELEGMESRIEFEGSDFRARVQNRAARRPASFTAADFIHYTQQAAGLPGYQLKAHLERLCLDPEASFGDPWYFRDLAGALWEMVQGHAAAPRSDVADTSVADAIRHAVEYAAETGSVVLLSGSNGIGKSFHARAECDRRPGRARYVQVPSGTDRRTFFKAFAETLGGPAGSSWKALELQERVEEILSASGLVVVIDDALQLLPDREREATPDRIDWIVTALAERGIPAVLITSQSFDVRMEAIQQRSRWSTEGFNQRVWRLPMPEALTEADIRKTAAAMLPTAKAEDVQALAFCTETAGAGSLRFLENARRSAEFVARAGGGSAVTAESIRQAVTKYALPSVGELAKAQTRAKAKATPRFRRSANPIQSPSLVPPAKPVASEPRPVRESFAPPSRDNITSVEHASASE